jgi:hypothetical protein
MVTILELILEKQGGKVWTGCNWFRIGQMTGFYAHGNKPSGYMKRVEILDW